METYLRAAAPEDVDLLFVWANDDTVRANAFSTGKISWEEHLAWFKKVLSDEHYKQYIYVYKGDAIGQIRLTIEGTSAEIDYSVCREMRCMGHGKIMLWLLADRVQKDCPTVTKLIARVKPENIASQQTFIGSGYQEKYQYYELSLPTPEKACPPQETRGGVLFLTNNSNALSLYDWLQARCKVCLYSEPLQREQVQRSAPDLIISYNYNYIIKQDIIDDMQGKIINMHISLLPWNRGFSPNIWSFIDDTPKGVTIHQINAGLDTGRVIVQRELLFDPQRETFVSTYEKLNEEIVKLFIENWDTIRNGTYRLYEQQGNGSYHSMKDLETLKTKIDFSWSDNIAEFLQRYRSLGGRGTD